MSRRRRGPDEHDLKLEGVLLAIGVHGPSAVFDHVSDYKWLRDNYRYGFHQVKAKLRETGMERHEVEDILLEKHENECVCWRCVMRVHVAVVRHLAELRARVDLQDIYPEDDGGMSWTP